MLVPEKLKLRNFCQHSDYELNLLEGTTAIVGPNGCGKTSLYAGIVYALTGWCDPAWGSQKEFQKDGEALPGYAQVTFSMEDSDDSYVVRRYTLTGGKFIDNLEKNGELVASKRQKVNEQIEALVGIPCNLLAQLMWCRQESLSWLLLCPPAGVNQVLAQLFDCSKIEKLRDTIKKACDCIPLLRNDFDAKKKTAEDYLNNLPDFEVVEANLSAIKNQHLLLQTLLATLNTDGLLTSTEKARAIEELKADINKLRASIKAVEEYPKPQVDLRELENEVSAEIYNTQNLCTTFEVFRDDAAQIKLQLESLTVPTDTCSLCGHSLTNVDEYIANNVASITKGKFRDLDEALNQATIDLNKWEQDLLEKREYLEQQRIRLQSIRSNVLEWQAYEYWQNVLEQNARIRNELNQLSEQLTTIEQKETSDEAIKRKADAEIESDKLDQQIKETEQHLIRAKTTKDYAEHLLLEAEEDRKNYTRNETIRLMLTDIRASMSQSRGQAIFLNSKIDALNDQISDYMLLTDMPFSLWLDKEEHLFKYKMLDDQAIEHSAAKLSGAQKAIASLVIQLALINTCNVQCRLLLFDEVDAALSPENKAAVVALQRSLLADSSFKLLFITQSEQLTDSCDNVVTLS